ncbi:MAG: hypothetical protein RI556_06980 [Hydrogenovibrio sp.]|uniref:hypothetical protein n=1 Tax=Hydrogenovibrio sp. TaxID=2065821 RepID=UPI002870A760|nr:hypothetical protein [Hydrogenovibrio sp.]MDR9498901.1 hypothetical protein [Hydrogenovibrio sp.]
MRRSRVTGRWRACLWLGWMLVWPFSANAYTQPCELVAQLAGAPYQVQPDRMATLQPPDLWQAQPQRAPALLQRNGAWFVYQSERPWFERDACAPFQQAVDGQTVTWVPVVLNRQTGVNAVVTSRFVIKVRKQRDLEVLSRRYGFNLITRLPNRFTAVFDVGQPASYDALLETLDRDQDIEYAVPIVSEP